MDLDDLAADPFVQLERWLADAAATGNELPEAFALATVSARMEPSVRFVLLRGFGPDGLRFYTNRASRKGRDLAASPRAAGAFWWPGSGRQLRVSGTVEMMDDTGSLAYWRTRPRGSQLAAWASAQGEEISDRDALEARVAEVARRFEGVEVPLPPAWGGYLLVPERFELWESRADRLHDRFEYLPAAGRSRWRRRRLQP